MHQRTKLLKHQMLVFQMLNRGRSISLQMIMMLCSVYAACSFFQISNAQMYTSQRNCAFSLVNLLLLGNCHMVTRTGCRWTFSLLKLLILILISNSYVKGSYFKISEGRVYKTREGGKGGLLCLFLAKFIDFVKVLLNIRWCCEQGAPCLFFANAMLTKCCLNASSDNQADSTIGSCRYKKRRFNKTWNELIFCKYQLANH